MHTCDRSLPFAVFLWFCFLGLSDDRGKQELEAAWNRNEMSAPPSQFTFFFFNFAEVFFLFVLLRDSLEEHLSILLVTLSDDPVTAALQLHI